MPGALLLFESKEVHEDGTVVEMVIWRVPEPVPPSTHSFKYRLYFGKDGQCLVRYDNERGKGDHKHIGAKELPYGFDSVDQLLADFRHDVDDWSSTP